MLPDTTNSAALLSSGETPGDRVEFETLMSDVSARLVATSPDEVEPVIIDTLERVRVFFEADRCGLLTVSPDHTVARAEYAAYAEGLPPVSGDINLAQLWPWAAHKLFVERVPVVVCRMADLPPEAAADRVSWEQAVPTRSNLAVPLLEGALVRRIVLIHWLREERQFPASYVPRLRVLGEMMVNALRRKQAFEELRQSEERLDRAAAAAGCGLWELDMNTGVIWATPEARALYGVGADETTTYDLILRLVHEGDRARVAEAIEKAMSEPRPFDETYRVVCADGVRWIHATGRAGDDNRLLGASVDVTELVVTSDRAREQAARVAAAVDAAELGFAEWDLATGEQYVDERLLDMLDIGEERSSSAEELWLARVQADDRSAVEDGQRRLRTGAAERVIAEYRYEHPRRGIIWLRHSARRVDRAPDGGPRVISAIEDITDRKNQEEQLRQALEDVQRLRERLQNENQYLRQEAKQRLGPAHIVGRGPAIRRTLSLAEQVGPTDSTVLLLGETGSGKERLASYIHECSRRRDRPMIRVNCSAIPTPLIESELFGREKGAYTGAHSKQIGRFELAHGSTLFLDEIGELPLEVQVKLLRVLENRVIERLGNPKPVIVDVRIVAATNRDLGAAVRDGRFREDLFYRLNVFPIVVPPLRDRREDIPLFVQAFIDEMASTMGKRIDEVDPASMSALGAYAWPGNVRELRNVVERAMILASGPILRIDGPPRQPGDAEPGSHPKTAGYDDLLRVLEETGWRIRGAQGAAARLGLNPTTLESRMKKLGVTRPGKIAHS